MVGDTFITMSHDFSHGPMKTTESLQEELVLLLNCHVSFWQGLNFSYGILASLVKLLLEHGPVGNQHVTLECDKLFNEFWGALGAAGQTRQVIFHQALTFPQHQLLKGDLLCLNFVFVPASNTDDTQSLAHQLELLCK
jgi:hypothetical protein